MSLLSSTLGAHSSVMYSCPLEVSFCGLCLYKVGQFFLVEEEPHELYTIKDPVDNLCFGSVTALRFWSNFHINFTLRSYNAQVVEIQAFIQAWGVSFLLVTSYPTHDPGMGKASFILILGPCFSYLLTNGEIC